MEFAYFVTWIILSILCGVYASGKGKSGFGYFLLSVLLSPLIGFIAALITKEDTAKIEKKEISKGGKRRCPFCAELIKSEAIVCKHCSKDIGKECPQCKQQNVIDASKCIHCGKLFENSSKDKEDKAQEAPFGLSGISSNDRCPKCWALQTKKDIENGQCWKCDESLV
jgi:hypothetical protein